MDERELQTRYRELQRIPCAFERIVLTRRCGCECAQRFHIAEREGVRCDSRPAYDACAGLLARLHGLARFALHLTDAAAPLPHGKELKVQGGGLEGLQRVVGDGPDVVNIRALVAGTLDRYGDFAAIPADELVRAISSYKGRAARR